MKTVWAYLENTRDDKITPMFFSKPVKEWRCETEADVWRCLEELQSEHWKKYYRVGYLSYEAGYLLCGLADLLASQNTYLLHFFAFEHCSSQCPYQSQEFSISSLELAWDERQYAIAFQAVKQALKRGDTYQVNLTSRYQFEYDGSFLGLYQSLRARQKVAYSGVLSFHDTQILTLSPELFFRKTGDHIQVKPMKGTIQRGETQLEDQHFISQLQTHSKTRAENSMIVDLLRNDLARLALPNTLHVSELLAVETYQTLHQMVSVIEAQLKKSVTFKDIIQALFPSGSITGAPKKRTMEIIHAVEGCPRGIYTGAIGYILPNQDMCFNVAIRTLFLKDKKGELGVGGGIVYDSQLQEEFAELKLKARFFTDLYT